MKNTIYAQGKMASRFAVTGLALALAGCFGGSSSGSGGSQDPETATQQTMDSTTELEGAQTGELQDAAVEGMTYWTASAGVQKTDENGSFDFEPGEAVAFYLGNDRLIFTDAELYTTPMDTMSHVAIDNANVAGHPHEAINILRVLQTIDASDSDSVISIPGSFDKDGGAPIGFDLASEADDLSSQTAVATLFTTAGTDVQSLVGFTDAGNHLEQTLSNIDDAAIDLSGTWDVTASYREAFGQAFADTPGANETHSSCEDAGQSRLVINDESGFQYGDEIRTETDGTCSTVDYASTADGNRFTQVTRNGNTGVEWDIDAEGIIDLDCGPVCSLADLRTTVTDWDALCMSDAYFANNPDGGAVNHDEVDYCEESSNHNGPIVGYSDVAFVDRLGGDRLIRIKRDYFTKSGVPAQSEERADSFEEQGFFVTVMDRLEAVEHTVDLTDGEWTEVGIGGSDKESFPESTVNFSTSPSGSGADVAPGCDDMSACTWRELNRAYSKADGNGGTLTTRYIYVRGTETLNWVNGDTVGTLKRVAN
ncbi:MULTISPECIES: hypothetical protein [Halomonadaceae]|uniref:Lipoprotein n=1 Tax=Vreelandella halophila TaxID=86177 RepID=A0A9X4YD90_9GAMM|nr:MULTISPECIES: hypothetical protein [Halomonas]MYL27564.1 hypothetical protein [Halomonas utahensis]MYL74690.1 hypothetical protein [Halomonas sp. 22501_18_FS]